MLELQSKDGASILVRPSGMGFGDSFESAHRRGAPSARWLANNRTELEALRGAVFGRVEVDPFVPLVRFGRGPGGGDCFRGGRLTSAAR